MTDTIFAVATGVGRAAIAIIRMSGPVAGATLAALAGPLPRARVATLRRLHDPGGVILDDAIVLWFPAPASATGEDMAECHVHGGRAVVAAVLAAFGAQPGCRLAAPGEFTRRAFLNGKMDLAAVEGLADLIDAETEAQRRQALRQLDGALGTWVAVQRARLLDALAAAESAIDFSDEGDVAGDFEREVRTQAEALLAAIRAQLRRAGSAARVREGLTIALAGPPNAGKSTLLNALARREVAIVSPVPGTTRDAIAVRLDFDGYLVEVVDTAGLRPTDDPVEREGVARALSRAQTADLVLWLSDVRTPCPPDPALGGAALWRVATKVDLSPGTEWTSFDHAVAAPTGAGLDRLVAAIKGLVDDGGIDDGGVATRERHRAALAAAEQALLPIVEAGGAIGAELAAEQLRVVARRLDSLIGRIATEEVLASIFARFCIGK